jgi:uncharacterized protein
MTQRSRLQTCFSLLAAGAVLASVVAAHPARAQSPQTSIAARIIVIGEGSVSVSPDRAQIQSGVTTRAKTAKEAADDNARAMSAIMAALAGAGIAQKDIQTARFSVEPVYATTEPKSEPKLAGYSVSNQVRVTIGRIDKLGEALDRLVAAGATDVGNIVFLVSDQGKYLDQAREAAVADAKRKAALYANAAGMNVGRVAWITEDSSFAPPITMAAMPAAARAAAPIASGEETLHVRITVGFDVVP